MVDGVEYTKRTKDDDTVVSSVEALFDAGDGPEGWDLLPTTCTSGITNMSGLFATYKSSATYPSPFNEDISSWDVSSVTIMNEMFRGTEFDHDLNDWDVSSVENMSYTFVDTVFNGDISDWNVSSVTNMSGTFSESAFTGDISDWNVGSVTNMGSMFAKSDFNQDIGRWDTSKVTQMGMMFWQAKNFNQDLSDWCVSNVLIQNGKPSMFNHLAPDDWTQNSAFQPKWGDPCPE